MNKIVLVTGSSRGIGKAIALTLAKDGYDVIIQYNNREKAEEVKQEIEKLASRMGNEKTIEGISVYGPSEAGVIKFSKCCALEFAPFKIRVNTISPGLTNTDLTKDWIEELGGKDAVGSKIPSGRVAEPQDIANVVSFLASDKASYINGENIGVNGGSVLG